MKVIAVMGRSRSGKDTIGKIARELMPGKVVTMAFADKLKRMCMELYGLSEEDVYTEEGKDRVTDFVCWKCPACQSIDCFEEVEGRTKRIVCRKCTAVSADPKAFESKWTVRMILQHIGTEGCRRVDPYVWVNFIQRNATHALEKGVTVMETGKIIKPSLVLITDCRFRSEFDGVQKFGGAVWRLRRPTTDRQAQGLASHASENEMDTIPDTLFQHVIVNDGTLEQLQEKVKEGLEAFMSSE